MTRSKRAKGRAAKRKSAVTGEHRSKPSKFYRPPSGAHDSEVEIDVATLTLCDALRSSQHNWSSNSARLRDKSMKFVPSSEADAFKPAELPIIKEVQQQKIELSRLQSASPSPSNSSSEDVVVFAGRANFDHNNAVGSGTSSAQYSDGATSANAEKENSGGPIPPRAVVEESTGRANTGQNWLHREDRIAKTLQRKLNAKHAESNSMDRPETVLSARDNMELPLHTTSEPVRENLNHAQIVTAVVNPMRGHPTKADETASADYIQNVTMWEPDLAEAWAASARPEEWSPSDLEDFDELSTSDEVCDEVDQVLSKRYRSGLLQYLVVGAGHSIDEARWIPFSYLTMPSAKVHIENYEEKEKSNQKVEHDIESSDEDEDIESEDESSDAYFSGSEDRDKNDRDERDDKLMRRRMENMSDEQLARLFAKQEELGIHADELLVFDQHVDDDPNDEEEDDEEDGDMEYDEVRPGEADATPDHITAGHFSTRYRVMPAFAEGALDALQHDDYQDFDIMDFDRPSLVKGNRRWRQGSPSFGLSDSDLEQNLKRAWAADRDKKRIKKQEREEMRAQCVLGKKNKSKPDLKAKYSNGLSMDDFKYQLESFLDSEHTTLALPPMDKTDRRAIHTIVNSFNLRSKSQGNGKSRFTIVYRTTKTIRFSDTLFNKVAARVNRQHFARMDKPKGHGGTLANKARAQAGVSYGHGETVGAGAPELGTENRGRAMLERMGWTKGDALGSLENQGILQPIAHVVRKSRAGLG